MKEKTADTEGHRIKVGLDQHKSFSSSSTAKVYTSPKAEITSPIRNKDLPSKTTFLSPTNNNNNSSSINTSNNNTNFDDDYNEWDISIGDLIIDLDADIERQSEGDKSAGDYPDKNESSKSITESANCVTSSVSSLKQLSDTSDTVSVMSSNFNSNRLNSLSGSGSGTSTHNSASTSANNNSNIIPTSPNPSNANGVSVGHIHRHHHGHSNQRNNYSVSPASITSPTNNSLSKNSNSALVEHHAKSLKMKIKRKNVGGKISEINHEIVSSDTSPPNCKTYVSSFDHNSNPVTTSIGANNATSTIHVPNSTALSSANSVITANTEGVSSPTGELLLSSKSSKHSNKNKSCHRDKPKPKDKIKVEKEKFDYATMFRSVKEGIYSASPTLASQPAIPNLTLKYSTSSPTVIIKSDENSKTVSNTPKKNKMEKEDDKISERRDIGTSTSIATITEPDCLGPCEPGTSVTLEGIVWQETEGGVLVVNVTWRGKTYVGTLLDCTKHDWAPPRFCESPTSDIESKSLKNTRGKRARNNFISDSSIDTRSVTSKLRNGKGRRTANSGYVPPSPAKSDSSVNSSKRKGRPSDLDLTQIEDTCKRVKSKSDIQEVQPVSPVLIECPEPNCSKKYKHINGLKYHQSHAHMGSTFMLNDSQDPENCTVEPLISDKSDTFDGEYTDLSNPPDSPSKNIPSSVDKSKNVDSANVKSKLEPLEPTKLDNQSFAVSNTHTNLQEADPKKLPSNSANELLVSDSTNRPNFTDKGDDKEESSVCNNSANNLNKNSLNANLDVKDNVIDSNGEKVASGVTNLKNTVECDPPSAGNAKVIHETGGSGVAENETSSTTKSADKVKSVSSNDTTSRSHLTDKENDIENVTSPAYSDISDDTNMNDSTNELVNLVSSTPSLEKNSDTVDGKNPQNSPNFNISSFPPYFNKSQYLGNNSGSDSKPPDTSKVSVEASENIESLPEKSPQSSYPPYSFYRFGTVPSSQVDPEKYPDVISKPNLSNNSQPSLSTSNTSNSKNDIETAFSKDKSSESAKQQVIKESHDYGTGKQPIVELQNLKNRIQNFAFDQGSLYENQKQKYSLDNDKEHSNKLKDKTKHSPQNMKPVPTKDKDDKQSVSKSESEGVKPTMETTGPPPPTNGYYYNPSFLPHSFPPISPFDSMFRGNAMNVVMGSPYCPPPASSFLHSQMRFPPMGSLDSLSMQNNVSRSTSQSPATSSSAPKTTSHHPNSFNQNPKMTDRGIMSPSSTSHSSTLPPSYHKSPSKEFGGSMNSTSHSVPVSSASSDHRGPMNAPSSSLHPPRHPLHSASHVGYPIFDPYSAMIVNHASNPVQMHPFTPK